MPPMRPIFYEFPEEEKYLETQDVSWRRRRRYRVIEKYIFAHPRVVFIILNSQAWMIGDALLVHPVVTKGATSVTVQLPERDGNKVCQVFGIW